MTTRQPDSTHEAEQTQPLSQDDPRARGESPSADRMQGANGVPLEADDENASSSADQDIDTAGTDADDQSPTKAMGTGIAPDRSKG
ncbi:MAG TPA: hypothetical protein VNT81_07255 [Vicinamibacterales bacterium]|nr:hypothetical protein [Vicinamibacterales bacterium]